MAAASLTRDFMMFDYVMQLKVACERIRADNERRVQRYIPELERYAAEAFRNPGDILTPPPQCHPPDVNGEAARLMHANFGILWTSMKCKEPAPAAAHSSAASSAAASSGYETGRAAASAASSRAAPPEAPRAGREDLCCSPGKHKAPAPAGSALDFGSPSKRPRTFQEVEEPARPALAEPAREAFAASSGGTSREAPGQKASLPQEALASFAKSMEKLCEKGPDRSVRQGPLAAPSPCRAQRLGPMPSSPPQRPPPDQPQEVPGRRGWGLRLEEEAPQPEQPRSAARVEAAASPPVERPAYCEEPAAEAQPPLTARSFAPPAAFAMPSTRAAMAEEPLSPATPVPEFSAPSAWQGSALFAPPPPSPAPAAAGGAAAAPAASVGRVPPVALPPAPVPPPPPVVAATTEARVEDAEAAQQLQAGEVTPVPVSQRIMMFETRSTPCLGRPGAPPAPPGGSGQSRVRNGVAPGGSGGAVNGNSMFTPLRASASGMKPKELFRSQSELMRGGSKQAAQAPQGTRGVRPPAGSANTGTTSSAANSSAVAVPGHSASDSTVQAAPRACERVEAFERLAAGSRRDDVAKPKSLKAAELAKQQEERKQREKQEEKQERERARGLGASASTSTLGTAAASAGASAAAAPASARKVRGDTTPGPPPPTNLPPAPAAVAPSAEDAPASSAAASSDAVPRALHFPPVPSFGPEPHVLLRQFDLPPKSEEDNYEISEADSEEEGEKSRDRSTKHVPKWSLSYLEELGKQTDMDPDTIFASRVPKCDLETIFSDALYQEVGKNRPRRQRGSSGDWKKDRLTRTEIQGYKSRMGHVRSWEEEKATAVAGASAD